MFKAEIHASKPLFHYKVFILLFWIEFMNIISNNQYLLAWKNIELLPQYNYWYIDFIRRHKSRYKYSGHTGYKAVDKMLRICCPYLRYEFKFRRAWL